MSNNELSNLFKCYDQLFANRIVKISTAYKPLNNFYIHFESNQFCHLLGLHKIYNQSANRVRKQVLDHCITLDNLKRHNQYSLIKERINNIDFLRIGFIDEPFTTCILVSPVDSRNRMRLDLVFKGNRKNRILVLGLRKIRTDTFVPVTFFVTKDSNFDYRQSIRISITKIEWQ